MDLLGFAVGYVENISRQLGVLHRSSHYKGVFEPTDAKSLAFSGWHLFLLDQLMRDLGKRSANKCMLKVAQFIASKHVRLVRDKTAKEAEKLCTSGQCAAALPLLQKAINLGHFPSRALKAHIMIEGREGVSQDRNRMFELVEEGARFGCHHCQGMLAWCYWRGCRIRIDEARSVLELARDSSGKGSRYGQRVLGYLYESGYGGVAYDYAQAVVFYRLAAAQNFDEAQFRLGVMYYRGHGVYRDHAVALRLFQLAAAQGHPEAMYMVANCHEYGRGVHENKAEAIRWFRCALAAGHPDAADALRRLRA
jgi:TPR repeat protein